MRNYLTLLVLFLFGVCRAQHRFAGDYRGANLDMVAFPIGGIGAGMFCIDGNGQISHLSIRNTPDVFNTPKCFAAIAIKGEPESARVLEGPVPNWKKFSVPNGGHGVYGSTLGLARFTGCRFDARFPFAAIDLRDAHLPIRAGIRAWSPFIPGDADASSLPVGGLEYTIVNTGKMAKDFVFSFNSARLSGFTGISPITGGFQQDGKGPQLAFFTDEKAVAVDNCWFRGSYYDPLIMAWNKVKKGDVTAVPPQKNTPGASLFVPFRLKPGGKKTIRLYTCWYSPETKLQIGKGLDTTDKSTYRPWYAGRFNSLDELARYWKTNYALLKQKTGLFTQTFYDTTLPKEVVEAIAANLSTLKSPTVLRQTDGKFWAWEGCEDDEGSCPGSCTHVWNYAQALPHLFPQLERSLRETEFFTDQDETGHQMFRAGLPIRPIAHDFYAAADGQLGGILKVYRDWHISGDENWLRRFYPKMKASLDYCIRTWDPRRAGALEEPHHNTYDIELWGADGMCTSFYIAALDAMIRMGTYLHEPIGEYQALHQKAKKYVETKLFNGQYFNQAINWKGLNAGDPVAFSKNSLHGNYSPEGIQLLEKEGPKYQYGNGCLSDGIIGDWMARVCGLDNVIDPPKVKSHLQSVYRYNFKRDLSAFSNPARPGYAIGKEGGLVLCTWPQGNHLSIPFAFNSEVWTGIEYEVASHLIMLGKVNEGLAIVRTARQRYDGVTRNPFDEYECGHWYARALSSYALLQALTGVRYDAVTQSLYVHSQIGDFRSFLSTNTGFGTVVLHNGKFALSVKSGSIPVKRIIKS